MKEQFETVLPDDVLAKIRFRASLSPEARKICLDAERDLRALAPFVEYQSLEENDAGAIPPLPPVGPLVSMAKVRLEEDKLLKPLLLAFVLLLVSGWAWFFWIFTIPGFFFLLKDYSKFRRLFLWTVLGMIVLALAFAGYYYETNWGPHPRKPYVPSPVVESFLANPTPWATATPAPTPTPAPLVSAEPEVRRAEPVANQPVDPPQWYNQWRYAEADMPYGEEVLTKYLGDLPNQEALPWVGNRIGDTYKIGKDYFTWVTPGGVGQWVDPAMP